jgi:hypothetical protein
LDGSPLVKAVRLRLGASTRNKFYSEVMFVGSPVKVKKPKKKVKKKK